MSTQSLKPGWKMVKFGEVVKNANFVERDPEINGIERIVGLEHIDPEKGHDPVWSGAACSSMLWGRDNNRGPPGMAGWAAVQCGLSISRSKSER